MLEEKLKQILEEDRKVEEAKRQRDILLPQLRELFRDESIPVEKRWECYKAVAHILPVDGVIDHTLTDIYDKHYECQRYETLYGVDVVEMLVDELSFNKDDDKCEEIQEQINEVICHLLKKGISGCHIDW